MQLDRENFRDLCIQRQSLVVRVKLGKLRKVNNYIISTRFIKKKKKKKKIRK
jgi:hypothetical protein